MKKLITILIGVLITVSLSAQLKNEYKYVYKLKGGLILTKKVLDDDKVDSIKVVTGTYKIYQGVTQLTPDIPPLGGIDITDMFVKTVTDSVQHTAAYTVAASDFNKDQMCLKTTGSMAITLPPNLTDWPIGSWMTFIQEGGAILVFKKGSGVRFVSPLDSIATKDKGDMVNVKKIGVSAYILTDMTD